MVTEPLAGTERDEELRSYHAMAAAALDAYGAPADGLSLLEHKTNVTFKLEVTGSGGGGRHLEPGSYLLRIARSGEYSRQEIESEVTWLRTLRQAGGVSVPEPVAALDGRHVTEVREDGTSRIHPCTLFRWIDGEPLLGSLSPASTEQVGALLARIHRCAEQFVPGPDFVRPTWDCDRLFGPGPELLPPDVGGSLVSPPARALLDEAAAAVRRTVSALGDGRDVVGLIHKDLEPDNVVVSDRGLHAIDFADCGWGYYLYDVAASLLPLREKPGFAAMEQAFLRGYRSVRPLSARDEALLPTFTVARSLFSIRLMVLRTMEIPKVREYARTAIPKMLGGIRRYLEESAGSSGDGASERRRLTTIQFLGHVRRQGIELWLDGEKLRYRAPEGVMSSELRGELGERKAEIVEFLRRGTTVHTPGPRRVTDSSAGPQPVSFSQQRLWFLDQMEPGTIEYNIARAVRMAGPLRLPVLVRALNEVVRRHGTLRTRFGTEGGEPVQVVEPEIRLRPPLIDLSALPEERRWTSAQDVASSLAHRPFDLGRAPLLRILLLRLEEQEHVAASSMHHIIGDGWSTGLLFREMGLLYEAFSMDRPSPLPELEIQYTDFSHWQRRTLTGGAMDKLLDYWRRELDGAPQVLDLPSDRPRPAVRSPAGARIQLVVPAELTEDLRTLAHEEGATIFMVLFAAFAATLGRFTGREDLLLGSPIANRNQTEVEGLIGFFANNLVLRANLAGAPTFRELLGRVRATTLGAYAHQDIPFERLVEALSPVRRTDVSPLFQAQLSLQNVPHPDMQVGAIRMSLLPPIAMTSEYDLNCDMKEMPEGIRTSFKYRLDVLEPSTVARMVGAFTAILAAAAGEPDLRLGDLPLATPAERHLLLHEWNDTEVAPPASTLGAPVLHAPFLARAAAAPDATALVFRDEVWTYGALARRAGRMARRLRDLGVGPDTPVAVCVERSSDLLVALLGVLEAGGAYVPLDPSYPEERLVFMLADCGAPVVVGHAATAPVLDSIGSPEGRTAPQRLLVESDDPTDQGPADRAVEPERRIDPVLGGDHAAYAIYTSGSTGRPKGAVNSHRAVLNRLAWMQQAFPLGPGDRVLQKTPFSFDVSVWELFWPLLVGAQEVVAEPGGHMEPAYLVDLVVRERVTTVHFVPAMLRAFLAEPRVGGCRSLRRIVASGEALAGDLARSCHRLLPAELHNLYGPTEAAVDVSSWRTEPGATAAGVPIGRPIANLRLAVVDGALRPVPLGAPGELVIGGVGLARGYLGRPGLTAERFVPDPVWGGPGSRVYRTGDLARHRAGGEIEFLGRIDHQVKVRGVRIELGEIEAALLDHPAVRAAVAVVAGGPEVERRLVAYAVPEEGAVLPPTEELAGFLGRRLPDAMVPRTFVALESLPLTPSGKVDRRALPEPEWSGEETYTPPRTPVEEVLAAIWAGVLGLERVGIDDDFFHLGGHSLLATQVVSRIRAAFGVEVPVRSLFEAPTVARLAALVERGRDLAGAGVAAGDGGERAERIVAASPRPEVLPLSFSQERLWILDRLEPGTSAYNVPAAVRLEGHLELAALAQSLDRLVARHESLRTSFPAAGGTPRQEIAPHRGIRLPMVDLGSLPADAAEAEAERVARREASCSFDLARGPLLRLLLVRVRPEGHLLMVDTHHVVSDGWSVGVMIREMGTVYAALVEGRRPELPELPVQYADFALWQRRHLQGPTLERHLTFWRGYLGGDRPPLALPADRPRPAVQSFRGGAVAVRPPRSLSQGVTSLAGRTASSPFMVLLGAFAAWIQRVTGEADVNVGTFIANRTRAEIEPLIGFFVNTLVLRTRPEPEAPFRGLVEGVRESALAAYAHQDLPFERLLEEIRPERALDHTPLFQVMFVFQNAPMRLERRLPGLELRQVGVEANRSNFDLTLWMWHGDDGLEGSLHYASDLFDRTTALRFVRQLEHLLEAAVADPERSLGRLSVLGPAERHQVLHEWGGTGAAEARPVVEELVARQAAERPDAVALVFEDRALTYGALDRRARRVAARLADRLAGVAGPAGTTLDRRVAVLARRGPDAVVGLLAALYAGAGYVALDPDYPADRLALMLGDAGVVAVLAEPALRELVPVGDLPTVDLSPSADGGEGVERVPAAAAPPVAAPPGATAYVVFTSGSTGRPKGVAVSRGALASFVGAARRRYGFEADDRILQFASLSFDASAEEIWGALAVGATLVLRTDAMLATSERFLEACRDRRVTVLDLPTAYWHQLAGDVAAAGLSVPSTVRLVILGGEKASAAHWAGWFEATGGAGGNPRLVNSYGPTEATVVATAADLGAPVREPWGWREAPIGRPLSGVRAAVLDPAGRPVPPGVPGELALGGAGLARGYLGDPAKTAERFVPDPFDEAGGGRLYRTGDLVRWGQGGELEFVGRLDHQVKVRGFRVEPGEVESVLAAHPAIAEVLVDALDGPEGARLVAWTAPAGEEPAVEELRAHLAKHLPEYMHPTAFVSVESLPRTTAGKVDRAALPTPQGGRSGLGTPYVAPRNPTEEVLAGIWSSVLGVEQVGARDDFFDLGGHSLLATQAIARVESTLGVELPLRTVFEAPTLEAMAARVEGAGPAQAPPLVKASRDREVPLSFSQERIWFLTELDPASASYHVPRALRILGELDRNALRRAYAALMERHEILRTTFPAVGGRPVQRIHPPAPVPIPVVDLAGLSEEDREREVERLAVADGARTFDLERGPLLRATLLRCGEREHVALQTEHHLVHDGWAEAVLIGDLLELYRAHAEDRPPALPELPIQYADFACWQRDWLRGEALERQLAYWRDHLEGAPPLLELPTDRPRPPVQRSRGGAVELEVPPALGRALTALGRREGATLFMVTLAAFELLLLRLTGQDDLVVGTGIANRRRKETEGMLGMIINTLALRTDLSGDPTFTGLLPRMRETCLDAYTHQDLPFGAVVEALRPERSLSHSPIFQILFAFHDAEFPSVRLPGLELHSVTHHNRSSKFDLVLIATPTPDRGDGDPEAGALGAHVEYDADLFDRTTIQRLVDQYRTVLETVVEAPETPLSRVPLLSAAQMAQILREWNDSEGAEGSAGLHELVMRVAEEVPDRVAVATEGEVWSYGAVARRADRLARRLAAHGVRPGDRVALYLERSPAVVAAMLGVLEAGAVYVPLDPAYPPERLRHLTEDSEARVVVVAPGGGADMPASDLPVLELDGAGAPEALGSGPGAARRLPGEAPAYVIYTSGSTGVPKGVVCTHRSAVNLVEDYRQWGRGGAVTSWWTSPGFDVSVCEVFGALADGGTVRVPPAPVHAEGRRFVRWLAERRIESAYVPPSMVGDLHRAAEERPRDFALTRLLVGVEPLPRGLLGSLRRHLPDTEIVNGYGPTEATIFATYHHVPRGEAGEGVAPIGRPVRNDRVYLCDRFLRPVPTGVPGELLIGGVGLAHGYHGKAAETAARFVPDPWSPEPGGRLYRTGDLARFLADGEVEFLGRFDHQVKIQGLRIELGEIEEVLKSHPAVRQAAVVVLEPSGEGGLAAGGAGRRLVAYLVLDDGAGQGVLDELKRHLAARLPGPMVPGFWVLLDELPQTAHGKLDRRALPEPAAEARAERVAPRSPQEEVLAGLFEEVLRAPEVGAFDDFFSLGGHSLLATQLVSRIREAFGVDLPLRAVFEAPTVAALAESVRRVGPERGAPPLVPVDRQRDLPLSFAQQRLWFLEQLEPGSPFYNIPAAVRLTGRLDLPALAAALGGVAARHDSLRTRFVDRDGEAVQEIVPSVNVAVPVIDLSGLCAGARERELAALGNRDARSPFDLTRAPLFRSTVLRLGAADHVLVLNLHHIISDGWSTGVLTGELMELYRALVEDRPVELPELPVQYADYAVWQRSWLRGEVLAEQLDYWRRALDGVTGLELPTDRPRPPVETFRGARHDIALSEELTGALQGLARSSGVTLYMLLMAAFQAVIGRVSRSGDVPVGSPIANRNRREVEGLIGFFANTLVFRTPMGDDPPFERFLERVRETALEAYARQELPFEKLVEEIQPERDMSRNPLFQVMCVLQNQPRPPVAVEGLEMSSIRLENRTAKFDLTFFWREDQGRLYGALEYNTDLFDATTTRRLLEAYERALRSAAAEPGRRLGELELLGPGERQAVLCEWNDAALPRTSSELDPLDPAPDSDRAKCVHRLVERQAERVPDAIAAVFHGHSLSYGELDRRANRLARVLQRRGVGPEALVGICLERSLEMEIALLAVLKAGGAGVALDRAYPRERLATIIDDSGLRVLLTSESFLPLFPGHRETSLCLEPGREPFPEESAEPVDGGALPDHPIYAIYTSGSTGRPKGIVVTHRAFANLMAWQRSRPDLAGPDRTVQFSTFGFCVSFQEIFSAWCAGGTLVVADEDARRDIDALPDFLDRWRVERLHLPFAALKHLAEAASSRSRLPRHLREVVTAGEQLQVGPAVRELFRRLPGCSLHNQYGASETHVVSALTLSGRPDGWPAIPSVGRPVDHVPLYLLDGALRPVPVGVAGDLYAGGASVARGYLDDPVTTAEKMIPDPFSAAPGARLYRTGDVGRYLADGRIEYHGRNDTQIKVRGFRVEPGEIDTLLAEHPAVRDAAVVPQGSPDDPSLVAYLVLSSGGDEVLDALRELLRAKLPEYMQPATFVVLDALPINANGKLDREALPVPDLAGRKGAGPPAAPRTALEEVVLGTWADILEVDPSSLGRDDDFFALGGHSLLATRVISRVRTACGVELPLRDLFERPTVAGLAQRVAERMGRQAGPEPPPLERGEPGAEAPLSFAQERLWFLDRLETASPAYTIYATLRLTGPLDAVALSRAFDAIRRRHEVLRASFPERGDRPVQVIAPFVPSPLPAVDLRGLPAEARDAALVDAGRRFVRRPFELDRGSLLRLALARLGDGEHAVLLAVHHVVSDGWSLEVLVRELSALYSAFSEGRPSPLAELPIQYGDYARWQRSWLAGEALEAHLGAWRRRLEGAPVLDLPTDRPRPPVPSLRGDTCDVSLPAETARKLRALAAREGASLFMTLLAGFELLLYRSTGQPDLVVGSDVANRSRPELEGLVGFFVNQLALRTVLDGEWSFRRLVGAVRDVVLEAHLYQDLPFERLVDELDLERDVRRNPLFQVVFALQMGVPAVALPGLEVASLPVDTGTSKVDLTLGLVDSPDGLAGAIAYSTDLFDGTTIARMAGHLETLLTAVAEDADRSLDAVPMLAPPERHQVMVEWNDAPIPRGAGDLWELLDEHARRTPEREAVRFEGRSVSYRELRQRAARVATELGARGVGPETVVAVLAWRGPDLLAAVLGILGAGAAFLPLDPYHPVERHAGILERSGAALVLAGEAFFDVAVDAASRSGRSDGADPDGPEVAALEPVAGAGSAPDAPSFQPRAVPPDGLAYVIYTSGSTGAPKGAMVHRAGMTNHLWDKVAALDLVAEDVVVQNASQCFDISIWQMFAPVLVGAAVDVVPDEVAFDGTRLLAALESDAATVFEAVPSMLRAMLEPLEESPPLPRLRWVLATGEALPPELARRWLEALPGVPLLNAYGPTECSDDVTHEVIRRAPAEGAPSVAIGRTLPGLRLQVLDRAARPVALGVPGELCVAGVGVGRGYLGQPALTAEVFIPDPDGGSASDGGAGGRLYRTGDLVRWSTDGRLEFLGRLDHQVKVRGFRIELGEIETVLESHPAVEQAVVAVRQRGEGERRLVAWIVPSREATAGTGSAEVGAGAIDQWRQVFDETYGTEHYSERDAGVSLALWTSSYTDAPLPEDEILASVEESVERIAAFGARRVLEIGCGTGLLLSRLAPSCDLYWGTDLSAEVLDRLRARLDGLDGLDGNPESVRLLERAADELDDVPDGFFDLVVLNEVVQYFPGADYLGRVLDGAVRVVRPGGAVFVGGVRSFGLLEAFHASVEAAHAPAGATVAELRERVAVRSGREKELAVAPELFGALARRSGRIGSAALRLKGGRARNELSKFRYDVTLRVGTGGGAVAPAETVDWDAVGGDPAELVRWLGEEAPRRVIVDGIPDARTAEDAALVELLVEASGEGSVDELMAEARRRAAKLRPVEPADLVEAAARAGYDAAPGWMRSGDGGRFQVLLVRVDEPTEDGLPAFDPGGAPRWTRWTNNPLQGWLGAELVPALRDHLAKRLPDYMVPSAMVVLDALPLTANGKVDRRALPEPDRTRPELEAGYVAPRNDVERGLASIWSEVLGVDRVGVHDDFFALGGHSLLATQVLSRVRGAFSRELPLRELFDRPTVARLAERLAESPDSEGPAGDRDGAEESPAIAPIARDRFRSSRAVLDDAVLDDGRLDDE